MGLLVIPLPAVAEEPHEGVSAVAEVSAAELKYRWLNELFDQGTRFYSAGRYHEAETSFLGVWRELRTYDVAANLGHVKYKLGKMLEAATLFSYALENAPLLWRKDQRAFVEQRLAEAKAQLGTLILRVSRPGAEVTVDGKRLEEAPTGNEVFVMPGKHRIEAKLDGYEPAVTTVDVGKETSRVVALILNPVEHRTSGGKNEALIVSGAAVSVAMVGVGVGLYVASASPLADVESLGKQIESASTKGDCLTAPNARCAELSSAGAKSDQLRNWGTAALITGGVVGAGTLVYSLWPSSKPEVRTGVRVLPVASGSTGGVAVLGRF